MKYDYKEAMKADIREHLKDNGVDKWALLDSREDIEQKLQDELWVDDSVTGNGSGSYTFSRWEAEENLCHNFDLLGEAMEEYGYDTGFLIERGAEAADVLIRCWMLPQALREVLDEIEEGR